MTTNSATQTPPASAAGEQPEVIYDNDPRFVGCSRFEWCTLRHQPRWRYLLGLVFAPFPGTVLTMMMLPHVVRHLLMPPDGARVDAPWGALWLLGLWLLMLIGIAFYGARSNEREFSKRYSRVFDWEIDEARAYFVSPHRLARPTLGSLLRQYWYCWAVVVGVPTTIFLVWGAGEALIWTACPAACAPWLILRGEQIEWDDRLSKFGAYLCGPPAPAMSPLDKS